MNVVIVKHEKSDKHYLFIVPRNNKLSAGDLVLLDTKNGNQIGFCISDSFTTPKGENTAMKLYQAFGLNDEPSARVIGKLTLEDWSKSKSYDSLFLEFSNHCIYCCKRNNGKIRSCAKTGNFCEEDRCKSFIEYQSNQQ